MLPFAVDFGGSVVATTDYIYEGLSQTRHDPALQGDLHWRASDGSFIGVWATTANPPPDRSSGMELNLYAGHQWNLGPQWSATLTYTRYAYPDSRAHALYDHDEWRAALSFEDRVTVSAAFKPDVLRYSLWSDGYGRGAQWTYEATFRQALWHGLSLTAGAGYYDLDDLFRGSYWAWNGGLAYALPHLQLSAGRFGVQSVARRVFGGQTADGRWALTAVASF